MNTNNTIQTALVYRLSQCEAMIAKLKQELGAQHFINNTRMAQIEARMVIKTALAKSVVEVIPNLEIPQELRHTHKYKRRGKKQITRNKNPITVQKRWDLWKNQLAAGISRKTIAEAWNCDPSTIDNAKRANFKAKYL